MLLSRQFQRSPLQLQLQYQHQHQMALSRWPWLEGLAVRMVAVTVAVIAAFAAVGLSPVPKNPCHRIAADFDYLLARCWRFARPRAADHRGGRAGAVNSCWLVCRPALRLVGVDPAECWPPGPGSPCLAGLVLPLIFHSAVAFAAALCACSTASAAMTSSGLTGAVMSGPEMLFGSDRHCASARLWQSF